MSRRTRPYVLALLAASAGALAVPSSGLASSGGAGIAPGITPHAKSNVAPVSSGSSLVTPGNVIVSASGNGVTVATHASALLRGQMRFTGTVPAAAAGNVVEIERSGRQTNGTWKATTHGVAASDGSFSASWPTNHIGQFKIRAVIERQAGVEPRQATFSPTLGVTVYRPSLATMYGPGFWGQRTACGQTLKVKTLGVANRTLPCGTPVAIYYRGRTITVPVIDRGPYANGADWDLTEATDKALGIDGTATIGAVSVR